MAPKNGKVKIEFDKVERLYEVIGGLVERMGGLIWMDIWTLDVGHWTEGNGAEEVRPGKLLFFMGMLDCSQDRRCIFSAEKKLSVCFVSKLAVGYSHTDY